MSQRTLVSDTAAPDTIGQYRVHRRLGDKPNMGEVFLAEDTSIPGRMVAIKTVPNAQNLTAERKEDLRLRLEREARALASVSHPAIPIFHHTILESGGLYLVMEYIEGQSLAQLLKRGEGLPQEKAVEIALGVLDALAAAHARGFLHRDVKPGNIMLTPKGQVKLIDFGLAKKVQADVGLTQLNVVPGTIAYMAPEQFEERVCSEASDLFSLGIVLYEMLVGHRPFESTSDALVGLPFSILTDTPPDIRDLDPTIPPRLASVVMKALAKAPSDRFASAEEMAQELRGALSELITSPPALATPLPRATQGRPRRWTWAAALLAACAGIATAVAVHLLAVSARESPPTTRAAEPTREPATGPQERHKTGVPPGRQDEGKKKSSNSPYPVIRDDHEHEEVPPTLLVGKPQEKPEGAGEPEVNEGKAKTELARSKLKSPPPGERTVDPPAANRKKSSNSPHPVIRDDYEHEEVSPKPPVAPPTLLVGKPQEKPEGADEPEVKGIPKPATPSPELREPMPERGVISDRQLAEVQSAVGRTIHNAAIDFPTQEGNVVRLTAWALDDWHKAQLEVAAPKTHRGLQLELRVIVSKRDFLRRMGAAIKAAGFDTVTLTDKQDPGHNRLRVELESSTELPLGSSKRIEEIAQRYHPLVHSTIQEQK